VYGVDEEHARRSLMLAGIAVGCSADFVWRGHRQSRPEYSRDFQTAYLLRNKGVEWAVDFRAACREVHALFRIREWGRGGWRPLIRPTEPDGATFPPVSRPRPHRARQLRWARSCPVPGTI